MMRKEIKVVCGLIYDDEFHARTGGTRFYHLNGDIEQMLMGKRYIFAQGKISIQVSLRIYPSL